MLRIIVDHKGAHCVMFVCAPLPRSGLCYALRGPALAKLAFAAKRITLARSSEIQRTVVSNGWRGFEKRGQTLANYRQIEEVTMRHVTVELRGCKETLPAAIARSQHRDLPHFI